MTLRSWWAMDHALLMVKSQRIPQIIVLKWLNSIKLASTWGFLWFLRAREVKYTTNCIRAGKQEVISDSWCISPAESKVLRFYSINETKQLQEKLKPQYQNTKSKHRSHTLISDLLKAFNGLSLPLRSEGLQKNLKVSKGSEIRFWSTFVCNVCILVPEMINTLLKTW